MNVTFEDKEYALEQDPYYSNGNEGQYQASARDAEGNEYMIYWNMLEGHEDDNDESEVCDWDNPIEVVKI